MTEQPESNPTTSSASSQILTMGKEDPKHKDGCATNTLMTRWQALDLHEDDTGSNASSATQKPQHSDESDLSDDLPDDVPREVMDNATGILTEFIQYGHSHFSAYQAPCAMYLVFGGEEETLKTFVNERVEAEQDPGSLEEMSTWQKGLYNLLSGDEQKKFGDWIDEKYVTVRSHTPESGTDARAH